MSSLILPPCVWTSSSRKVRRYGQLSFWAEGGRVSMVDERTGEYKTGPVSEFEARSRAFAGMADRTGDPHQRAKILEMLEGLKETLYEAREQGDPHDPEVLAWKARHRGLRTQVGGGRHYPRFQDGLPSIRTDGRVNE